VLALLPPMPCVGPRTVNRTININIQFTVIEREKQKEPLKQLHVLIPIDVHTHALPVPKFNTLDMIGNQKHPVEISNKLD
jgi:hypothetical protein